MIQIKNKNKKDNNLEIKNKIKTKNTYVDI